MKGEISEAAGPAVRLHHASLSLGERKLWQKLDLEVVPGEFLAVLGPNGSGKTTLLKVLLGLMPLSGGEVQVLGQEPRRGNASIGYVPQQKSFDPDLPIRGRDLVHFGLDGHKYGVGFHGLAGDTLVNQVIEEVGASSYADYPIGLLSGGEQQRLRIAQAILGEPKILLCDEPLLSLDLASQEAISSLIDKQRRKLDTAVIFVTHEINPILPLVDKVLYIAGQRWAVGKPDEVLTSETLSSLYGVPVEVLRAHGRIIVIGADEEHITEPGDHHHEHSVKRT